MKKQNILKNNLKKNSESNIRISIRQTSSNSEIGQYRKFRGFHHKKSPEYKDYADEYGNFVSPFDKFPTQPASPSADLATDMGTDSHKLQLMRASLFNDDVDDFEIKSGKVNCW